MGDLRWGSVWPVGPEGGGGNPGSSLAEVQSAVRREGEELRGSVWPREVGNSDTCTWTALSRSADRGGRGELRR